MNTRGGGSRSDQSTAPTATSCTSRYIRGEPGGSPLPQNPNGREAQNEKETDMKNSNTRDDIRTPVITVQVELRTRKEGGLCFWCTSSRKAHRGQRAEYSYSEADPFYRAATSYLSRQGFNEDWGFVVRSHFDKKPVKIFSFVK